MYNNELFCFQHNKGDYEGLQRLNDGFIKVVLLQNDDVIEIGSQFNLLFHGFDKLDYDRVEHHIR